MKPEVINKYSPFRFKDTLSQHSIHILQLLKDVIKNDEYSLDTLQEAFNHINYIYREWCEVEIQSQIASPPNVPINSKPHISPRVGILAAAYSL